MALPFPTIWQVDLASWVSMPPVTHGSAIVARVGDSLRAIDARDGKALWSATVDPQGGSGQLLHAYDDLQLTDRRPDPRRMTELVAVRAGAIAWTLDLGCVVTSNASVIAAGLLYVVGNGPTGIVLRGVDLTKRQITVDTPLPSGADGLIQVRDRFLILNRMASPGLYWVRPDGSYDGALEETPVAEAWASGGRLVAALRDGGFPQRTVQVRDLSSGGVLWTAPAHGAVIGIDGDAVGHVETGGDEGTPVLRDAATGQLRWRGAPFAIDPSRIAFAGAHVFFGHMTGITVYRRADGTPAGEIVSGATAQLLGERLYLGGFKFLACVDPDRVRA